MCGNVFVYREVQRDDGENRPNSPNFSFTPHFIHWLLVGKQKDMATMESSMEEVPQSLKPWTTGWPSSPTSRCLSRRIEIRILRHKHPYIPCDTITIAKMWKQPHYGMSWHVCKENGVLPAFEEKGFCNMCQYGKPGRHYTMWIESSQKKENNFKLSNSGCSGGEWEYRAFIPTVCRV